MLLGQVLDQLESRGSACSLLSEAVAPPLSVIRCLLAHDSQWAVTAAFELHTCMQVLQEALGWMAKSVQEFGLAAMSVPTLISWAKEDLGSPNAGVRSAATQLLAVMHQQLGPGLGDMIKPDVKPALWTGLEEAFKANPQQQVGHVVLSCVHQLPHSCWRSCTSSWALAWPTWLTRT